jgi:hypothetical protein
MAVLSGSCLAHDLAPFARLLLACWHAALPGRLQVSNRTWAIRMPRRITCHHQCWTVLHQPNARMATTMHPTLVAFGTFAPPRQRHIVCWTIGPLSPHKHPRLTTAPPRGTLLVHGGNACLPLLPPRDAWSLPRLPCGVVARRQQAINCSQVLDRVPPLRPGLAGDLPAAGTTTGQTRQPRLCTPPVLASRVRASDARTSWNASLIRPPGGGSGPPWSSWSIPRTAAQDPQTTSPASSSPSGGPTTAPPVVSRAWAVWPAPSSCRAQASGAVASGRATRGVSSAWSGPGAGEGSRAAGRRRSSRTRRSSVRTPRTVRRILTWVCLSNSSTGVATSRRTWLWQERWGGWDTPCQAPARPQPVCPTSTPQQAWPRARPTDGPSRSPAAPLGWHATGGAPHTTPAGASARGPRRTLPGLLPGASRRSSAPTTR